jgi:hypothetical protein
MANRINHQDIVKRLLDAKTVDFAAIGSAVGQLGPTVSMADEPWEVFCGTMRRFVRVYHINFNNDLNNIEDLAKLSGVAGELRK